jgi:hypothetical protein
VGNEERRSARESEGRASSLNGSATSPNPIREVLVQLELLTETRAAGFARISGNTTGGGHRMLWTGDDAGPASLRDYYAEQFAACRNPVDLRRVYESAKLALERGRRRSILPVVDGDWRPIFLKDTAGMHYAGAAEKWQISGAYARRLRSGAGLDPLTGRACG